MSVADPPLPGATDRERGDAALSRVASRVTSRRTSQPPDAPNRPTPPASNQEARGSADSPIRRTVLPNGVTVLTEAMPHVRSAAFGVHLAQGSRDETRSENGLSHFLEHFVFRGTLPRDGSSSGRSARDIAVETDLMGGELDAWTGRESTSYGVEVAAELLPRGADLVMDMVARPALEGGETFARERAVVREEMRGYEDDVAEAAFSLAAALFWPRHPLGRPVEGTPKSLDAFTPEAVREFWQRKHVGRNLLACAAGRIVHEEVVELVRSGLGGLPEGAPRKLRRPPEATRTTRVRRRRHLEQAHVIQSLPGLASGSEDMPAMALLATALGGGMSSRLWQRIREDEGLAYSVSLDHDGYRDCGRLCFYTVTAPQNAARALAIFEEEAGAVQRGALSDDEIERARQGLRSGMVLGMESPGERIDELAWSQMVFGRHVSLDERLDRLAAVTRAEVLDLSRRIFSDPRRNLVILTPDLALLPKEVLEAGDALR